MVLRSLMGAYWQAAEATRGADEVPTVIDMDGKLHRTQLLRRRYFCSLSWGSRHGFCERNVTVAGGGSG